MYNQYSRYTTSYTGKKKKRKIIIVIIILIIVAVIAGFFLKDLFSSKNKSGIDVMNYDDISPFDEIGSDENENENIKNQEDVIMPEPVKVKGVYVTAWTAGNPDRLNHYIELCDKTEINALVIDVKDDRGQITFRTDISQNSTASTNIIRNPEQMVSDLKSHGIYTIARIVCFKDPIRSVENPELAIKDKNGNVWTDANGNAWLNPYESGSWEYIVSIAKLAAKLGFDEVQFDYVRFPTDAKIGEIDHGDIIYEKGKTAIIGEFLEYAKKELKYDKIYVSADVFGIIAVSKIDSEAIGQNIETVLQHTDSVCPMIYPSHYANKRQNGEGQIINGKLFEIPDKQPYEVVYNTLLVIKAYTEYLNSATVIRPYLQDFTASYLGAGYYQEYSSKQVKEQIQAVYDAGFEEWILWNASSNYSENAFK